MPLYDKIGLVGASDRGSLFCLFFTKGEFRHRKEKNTKRRDGVIIRYEYHAVAAYFIM